MVLKTEFYIVSVLYSVYDVFLYYYRFLKTYSVKVLLTFDMYSVVNLVKCLYLWHFTVFYVIRYPLKNFSQE